MNLATNIARIAAVLAMPALIAGCASTPSTVKVESLLTAAGFKTVVASTDRQLKQIPTLPAGQVTVISNTGKNWFVYPDLARDRVYVGTQKEYRTYLGLRAQNNLPDVDPQASYYRQDAAMTAATARYASVPQWEWDAWPEFGDLGWQ
jgi:hypothetical protein